MSGERVERRLAAVPATDVVGYSRLVGEDEEGTLAALKTLQRELIDLAAAYVAAEIHRVEGNLLLTENSRRQPKPATSGSKRRAPNRRARSN